MTTSPEDRPVSAAALSEDAVRAALAAVHRPSLPRGRITPLSETTAEPTPTALAAKALLARIDNATHLGVIETRAVLAGWVGARESGLWDTHISDAVAKAAVNGVLDLLRQWAREVPPDDAPATADLSAPERTTP